MSMQGPLSPTDAAARRAETERHQLHGLIDEIWMMVDYVAGRPQERLDKIVVANPQEPGTNFTPELLLREVSDTQARLDAGNPGPYDRPAMQIVRDALNSLVFPASGLTIAYTTMVVGPLRGRGSRFSLAKHAYPMLVRWAVFHRSMQTVLLLVAVAVTFLAAWESAKIALGEALLQNLDTLRAQQVTLNADMHKLDLSLTDPGTRLDAAKLLAGGEAPLSAFRVCDRALVLMARVKGNSAPAFPLYATADERDLCGKDDVLRAKLDIVRSDLKLYKVDWPAMVGSGFALTHDFTTGVASWLRGTQTTQPEAASSDIEFQVAPVLLVWGNFILPLIFSFIGSAIFVILDHSNKIRASILHPRDKFLAVVRLALGLVVGACVGLFFSANGTPPSASGATNLISSLTLTASGVAFLAGFGVETVFSLLQATIDRVFTLPAAPK